MALSQRLSAVLDLIRRNGPISAIEIGERLEISEKQARSAIDGLRAAGEPIWNLRTRQLFAWSENSSLGEGWRLPGTVLAVQKQPSRLANSIALQSRPSAIVSSAATRRQTILPISPQTWKQLVTDARQAQWGRPGVFATAEGSSFERGGPRSLLYVGQSMGALGELLKLDFDQARNAEKARSWMENWRVNNPRSAFWQLAGKLANPHELAWSNIAKIDVPSVQGSRRGKPPSERYLQAITMPLIDALREEIERLRPQVTLFVTGKYCEEIVEVALANCNYSKCAAGELGVISIEARIWRSAENRWAVHVRHPRGTTGEWRSNLVDVVRRLR